MVSGVLQASANPANFHIVGQTVVEGTREKGNVRINLDSLWLTAVDREKERGKIDNGDPSSGRTFCCESELCQT